MGISGSRQRDAGAPMRLRAPPDAALFFAALEHWRVVSRQSV